MTTVRELLIAPTEKDTWYFTRVAEIASDKSNQIYVLDDLASAIHVFSSDGRRIRTLGRKGAGPGEFERPQGLQILGDTVFVIDRGSNRFVSFSTITGRIIQNRRGLPGQLPIGLSTNGMVHVVVGSQATGFARKTVPSEIVHTALASGSKTKLGVLPFVHGYLSYPVFRDKLPGFGSNAKSGSMQTMQPFDDTSLYQVLRDGREVVIVERAVQEGAVALPTQKSAMLLKIRVRRLVPTGPINFDREYTVPARPVASSDITAIVDSLSKRTMAPGATFVARTSDIRDSLYVPKLWPAVTELFAGVDGAIWLRQPQAPSSSAKFWRLSADGAPLAGVIVPSVLHIMQVTNNRIYAASEAKDGSPTVEVLRVVP